jgi:hypothetical protein
MWHYICSLPEHHEPVITIRIGDVHNRASVQNEEDYSGINFNIIRLHQLNNLDQVSQC